MTTTTRQRPSHYELLGLSPSATSEEIARAFAREIGPARPHALGEIAQVCAAYETLRDPAKRRAYDESIGIVRAPPPKAALVIRAERKADYLFANPPLPLEPSMASAPASAPSVTQAAAAAAPPAQEVASPAPAARSAGASSAAPAVSAPRPDPIRPEQSPEELEPWLAELIAARGREAPERLSLLELRRPGLVIGGLFAAVAIAGGLAGWWSASDIQDEPGSPSEAVALVERPAEPPVTQDAAADPEAAAMPSEAATQEPQPPQAKRPAPARVQAPAAEAEPLASVDRFLEEPAATAPEETTVAAPAEGTSTPTTEQARLPLPERTVARTIERIGYSCGKVASVTPMADASGGAFKVTCTSGDSYRAAPIRGRYHFRRLGGG